eukprot:6196607-Amphidinium_carterae.1
MSRLELEAWRHCVHTSGLELWTNSGDSARVTHIRASEEYCVLVTMVSTCSIGMYVKMLRAILATYQSFEERSKAQHSFLGIKRSSIFADDASGQCARHGATKKGSETLACVESPLLTGAEHEMLLS